MKKGHTFICIDFPSQLKAKRYARLASERGRRVCMSSASKRSVYIMVSFKEVDELVFRDDI